MDDIDRRLLLRLVKRIPSKLLKPTLEKWSRIKKAQLVSIDFSLPKFALTEKILSICEENDCSTKHITELEMLYIIDHNPNIGTWHAYQFIDPEDDAQTVNFLEFKELFKSHLTELVQNVSIKIKKHTDEAVWIRLAWGQSFSRPDHFKPTYVVHHLQSPFVFMTSVNPKHKALLSQSLILASRHQAVKDANLSGKLNAIRDLVMRQYEHVFPTKFHKQNTENQENTKNPNIEREQEEMSWNRHQLACEAFGGGKLPELQSAVYKLETKFRGHAKNMAQFKEPFKCAVTFSSTNLLESLRSSASTGISSTPVAPLLSFITCKARNYFVIKDNSPGASQT